MKRTIILLVLMAIAPKAFSQIINISAVAPSGQTLYYRLVNNDAYVVTPVSDGMSDSNYVSGDLIIPDTVFYNGNAYPVVQIWDFAFNGCSGLTSVVIGNGVLRIHLNAFRQCTNMRRVTIPNSVLRIEPAVFDHCYSLDSVVIPDPITKIERSTFAYCQSLTSVTIPAHVTRIEDYSFEFCHNLRSIDLPDSLRYIGEWAFSRCDSLTTVTIPDSVSFIGDAAFMDCYNLQAIWLKPTIPPTGTPFYQFPMFSNLVVPHDFYNDYIVWRGSKNYNIYSDTVYLTLNSTKNSWGYVVGADTLYAYPYDTIRLEAVANPGYEFGCWEDGSTDPVRLLTDVHHDTILKATFVESQPSGITDIPDDSIQVSTRGNHIMVSGADEEVTLLDIAGRQVACAKGANLDIRVPRSGVYILKTGSRITRKIVVLP